MDVIFSIAAVVVHIIWLVISYTAVIWLPFVLAKLTFFLWHHYRAELFIGGIEWALLEIHIPREMKKTPLAMELFFKNALYHMSQKGGWETYWQGAVHFWYSLELVSIDGNVHFFIRVPSRIRKLVETQLYSQFPQVRIELAEDYTKDIPKYSHDGPYYMWGCDFATKMHDAFAILTYKDFGLDKPGLKEEEKVDPMTPVIEFLGAIDRGEQVWIQIIIRQSEKMYHTHGTLFHHHDFYTESDLVIDKTLAPYKRTQLGADGKLASEIRIPATIEDEVKRAVQKRSELVFDTVIRQLVLADKSKVSLETFNTTRRTSRLLWRQYADQSSNFFNREHSTQYDSTWADPTGKLLENLKSRHMTNYKLRTAFYPPLWRSFNWPWPFSVISPTNPPILSVLSTEELATIFHFPGMVSETPSFKRLESKTAKPPSNLPT